MQYYNAVLHLIIGPNLLEKIKSGWGMSYQSSSNLEIHKKVIMTPNEAIEALKVLTPTNLHLKTNATKAQLENFHSVWFRHTPSAARYMLLPSFWSGELFIIE